MRIPETIFDDENLRLTVNHHGYWLWDKHEEINISMRAETDREALVDGITYYRRRFNDEKAKATDLRNKVNGVIHALGVDDEHDWNNTGE